MLAIPLAVGPFRSGFSRKILELGMTLKAFRVSSKPSLSHLLKPNSDVLSTIHKCMPRKYMLKRRDTNAKISYFVDVASRPFTKNHIVNGGHGVHGVHGGHDGRDARDGHAHADLGKQAAHHSRPSGFRSRPDAKTVHQASRRKLPTEQPRHGDHSAPVASAEVHSFAVVRTHGSQASHVLVLSPSTCSPRYLPRPRRPPPRGTF